MSLHNVTETEIKEISKIFIELDKALECIRRKTEEVSDERIEFLNREYKRILKRLAEPMYVLYGFEVTYNSFERYFEDKRYIDILKEGYELSEEFIKSHKNYLRLYQRPAGSKRAAIKELKGFTKNIRKQFGMANNLLNRKETYNTAEEAVYVFRDWLINDFDNLIDIIEPLRQEYIISRKGDVDEEEVEEMLQSKFEDYHLYKQWVATRRIYACVYYPDLKIE